MLITGNEITFKTEEELKSNYKKMDFSKFGGRSTIYKYGEGKLMKVFKDFATKEKLYILNVLKNYNISLLSRPDVLV